MNKIILFISTLLLSIPTYAWCWSYEDVSASAWYCPALKGLQTIWVLSIQATFSPNQNLNRAEALKMIYKSLWEQTIDYNEEFFELSKWNSWFKSYFVAWYWQQVIDNELDILKPETPISKAEFLTLMLKVSDINPWNCTDDNFESIFVNEEEISSYICYSKNRFLATKDLHAKTIDRAVAAQILYNYLTHVK